MIPRSVLKFTIGSNWRTFAGDSHETMADRTERILSELGWTYERHETEPSSGERTVFGAEDAIRIEIDGWGVTYTSITYDPLLRVLLSVSSSGETKERYKKTACIVDVRPITEENRSDIETLLQRLAADLDDEPWAITHPRFSYSPLLRYKVKLLWRYWLSPA